MTGSPRRIILKFPCTLITKTYEFKYAKTQFGNDLLVDTYFKLSFYYMGKHWERVMISPYCMEIFTEFDLVISLKNSWIHGIKY